MRYTDFSVYENLTLKATYTFDYITYSSSQTKSPYISATELFLESVTPPVGPGWKYDYRQKTTECGGNSCQTCQPCQNDGALRSVTYPTGGTIEYDYSDVEFSTGSFDGTEWEVPFSVLTKRTRLDRGAISGDEWSYSYSSLYSSSPASYVGDVTEVSRPDGYMDRYTYHAFGEIACNSEFDKVWRVGKPKQFELAIPPGGGTPLQTETWSWAPSDLLISTNWVIAPAYRGTTYQCLDTDTYLPRLLEHTVNREGVTYTTQYPDAEFDVYNQPGEIVEFSDNPNGSVIRTHFLDYWYPQAPPATTPVVLQEPWVIGRKSSHNENAYGQTIDRDYEYDSDGKLTKEWLGSRVIGEYEYDAEGRLTKQTDGDGVWVELSEYETLTWAGVGLPRRITIPTAGTSTCTVLRSFNWRSQVTLTDPQGSCGGIVGNTSFEYDDSGRRTKAYLPGWSAETIGYPVDSNGFLHQQTSSRGTSSIVQDLDGFGRVTLTTDSEGVKLATDYDPFDRVEFTSHPFLSGAPTGDSFLYDGLGRLLSTTHADGSSSNRTYLEKEETLVDEEGKSTTYEFVTGGGEQHRQVSLVDQPGNGSDTEYYYDVFGNLTLTRQGNTSAPLLVERSFTYDTRGHLIQENHPESGLTAYTRTTMGRVSRKTLGNGNAVCYNLDLKGNFASGRLLAYRPGCNNGGDRTDFTYDGYGHLTSSSSTNGGTYNYNYDGSSRLTSVTHTLAGSRTTQYGYDPDTGAVDRLLYPSGLELNYGLDSQGRLTNLSATSGQAIVANVVYHPSGQPSSVTWGSTTVPQATSSFSYDNRHRLTYADHNTLLPLPGDIAELGLGYDNVGNVTTYTRDGNQRILTYDDLHRLESATFTGAGFTDTFTYDGVGNVKTHARSGTGAFLWGFQYGGANRLWKRYTGDLQLTYQYDAAGNLIQHGPRSYDWTPAGWLAWTAPNEETFTYESGGLRVQKSMVGGDPTYYEYDPAGRILHEFVDAATDQATDYIYAFGRLAARVETSGATSELDFYFADHLGSPLAVHNEGAGPSVPQTTSRSARSGRAPRARPCSTTHVPPKRRGSCTTTLGTTTLKSGASSPPTRCWEIYRARRASTSTPMSSTTLTSMWIPMANRRSTGQERHGVTSIRGMLAKRHWPGVFSVTEGRSRSRSSPQER